MNRKQLLCRCSSLLLCLVVLCKTQLFMLAQRIDTPLNGTSQIVTPASLQADANVLLSQWMQGYTSQFDEDTPCVGFSKSNPSFTPEAVYRERIAKLPTAIPIPYNKQIQEGINLFLSGKRAIIPAMLSLGDYYFPVIETIFDKYGLPLELKYLVIVESAMNPKAVSSSGAAGLWQFIVPSAKAYGLEVNSLVDERFDLEKSTDAAARCLRDLNRIYNNWFMSIAAYNCGMGTVNKAIARSGGRTDFWGIYPFLPKQTRSYIPLFVGAFYTMHYHDLHQICPAPVVLPLATDTLHIHRSLKVTEVARAAGVSSSFFSLLNPQYKKGTIPGHIKPYAVRLPLDKLSALDSALRVASGGTLLPPPSQTLASASSPNAQDSLAHQLGSALPPNRQPQPVVSYYTIRRGDSLYKIARNQGVSLNELMQANNITSLDKKLVPGKKLAIPVAEPAPKVATQKKSTRKKKKRR